MKQIRRIGVLGPSGFVGTATLEAARQAHYDVAPISVRIHPLASSAQASSVTSLYPSLYHHLVDRFHGLDAVINAAGVAAPSRRENPHMWATNVHLPELALAAAQSAGIRRFVHVSSAAVQGRREPLDESLNWEPFSPYSRAKAEAERRVIDRALAGPLALVVYRATSIHGIHNPTTQRLARLARANLIPVSKQGHITLPVSLVDNLAAGLLYSATSPDVSGVILHPDEGITVRALWRFFNENARLINLPSPLARTVVRSLRSLVGDHRGAQASLRRVEVLLFGQATAAQKLQDHNFRPPIGTHGWMSLGQSMNGSPH